MEQIFMHTEWLPIIIATIVSFIVGAFWYSPKMFGNKWMKGVGLTKEDMEKGSKAPMFVQLIGTLLYAWIIGIAVSMGSQAFAILIIIAIAALIKSNGLWANKSTYAIKVETVYIIVMGAIMILSHILV